ncbi:MoeA, N-terminal and linker domain-containing protein [Pisolithus albus]|nr:MoeA, N-terminal and linker domain-containing protein [Pisolithus albus]
MATATTLEVLHQYLEAGCALVEDIYAPEEVPLSKTTNVDGYAVCSSDPPGIYKVLTSLTHKLFSELPKASIFHIDIGGRLSTGTNSAIVVEDTELESAPKDADGEVMEEVQVKTLAHVSLGENVRQPGSGMHKGENMMKMGEVIMSSSGEVGTLAFIGCRGVKVFRKPVVALLSTGNELLDLQSRKPISGDGWGWIWDTNCPSLQPTLEGMGYKVVNLGIAADDVDTCVRAISKGLELANILPVMGGTSMGANGLFQPVIEWRFNGTIHFRRVVMKPGTPSTPDPQYGFAAASPDDQAGPQKKGRGLMLMGWALTMPLAQNESLSKVEAK